MIFQREARAKLSTEAYYLGKSLAHLLTILAASFSFTVFYYALLLPVDVPICTYIYVHTLKEVGKGKSLAHLLTIVQLCVAIACGLIRAISLSLLEIRVRA